jgi:hypothetical protein
MIHQFIFAGPKPGLSAEAFQSYWINFHAVDFAARIPQIRQYLVSRRLPVTTGRDLPFFEGVAEIWLADEAEQVQSLQSPEFLDGARRDEPRWAAFWQTLGLDTSAVRIAGDELDGSIQSVKLYLLLKRAPTLTLETFRDRLLEERAGSPVEGASDHMAGFVNASAYGVGEPRFDAVETIAFADLTALERALSGRLGTHVREGWAFCDPRYLFAFAGQEHWIIRPGDR